MIIRGKLTNNASVVRADSPFIASSSDFFRIPLP